MPQESPRSWFALVHHAWGPRGATPTAGMAYRAETTPSGVRRCAGCTAGQHPKCGEGLLSSLKRRPYAAGVQRPCDSAEWVAGRWAGCLRPCLGCPVLRVLWSVIHINHPSSLVMGWFPPLTPRYEAALSRYARVSRADRRAVA